jgi:phosphoglycerate dehydrogenase-like enzyme
VIDEAAMLAALKSGKIAGAGLDVFHQEPLPKDHPFWGMKNVMMSPRIGGMSDIYDQQIMPVVTHNIRCLAEGRMDDMRNIVR